MNKKALYIGGGVAIFIIVVTIIVVAVLLSGSSSDTTNVEVVSLNVTNETVNNITEQPAVSSEESVGSSVEESSAEESSVEESSAEESSSEESSEEVSGIEEVSAEESEEGLVSGIVEESGVVIEENETIEETAEETSESVSEEISTSAATVSYNCGGTIQDFINGTADSGIDMSVLHENCKSAVGGDIDICGVNLYDYTSQDKLQTAITDSCNGLTISGLDAMSDISGNLTIARKATEYDCGEVISTLINGETVSDLNYDDFLTSCSDQISGSIDICGVDPNDYSNQTKLSAAIAVGCNGLSDVNESTIDGVDGDFTIDRKLNEYDCGAVLSSMANGDTVDEMVYDDFLASCSSQISGDISVCGVDPNDYAAQVKLESAISTACTGVSGVDESTINGLSGDFTIEASTKSTTSSDSTSSTTSTTTSSKKSPR